MTAKFFDGVFVKILLGWHRWGTVTFLIEFIQVNRKQCGSQFLRGALKSPCQRVKRLLS